MKLKTAHFTLRLMLN